MNDEALLTRLLSSVAATTRQEITALWAQRDTLAAELKTRAHELDHHKQRTVTHEEECPVCVALQEREELKTALAAAQERAGLFAAAERKAVEIANRNAKERDESQGARGGCRGWQAPGKRLAAESQNQGADWPTGAASTFRRRHSVLAMTPEEQIARLREALEMVLLYHSGSPWDGAKAKRWERWTGRDDASTKAMCDQIRVVLSLSTPQGTKEGEG